MQNAIFNHWSGDFVPGDQVSLEGSVPVDSEDLATAPLDVYLGSEASARDLESLPARQSSGLWGPSPSFLDEEGASTNISEASFLPIALPALGLALYRLFFDKNQNRWVGDLFLLDRQANIHFSFNRDLGNTLVPSARYEGFKDGARQDFPLDFSGQAGAWRLSSKAAGVDFDFSIEVSPQGALTLSVPGPWREDLAFLRFWEVPSILAVDYVVLESGQESWTFLLNTGELMRLDHGADNLTVKAAHLAYYRGGRLVQRPATLLLHDSALQVGPYLLSFASNHLESAAPWAPQDFTLRLVDPPVLSSLIEAGLWDPHPISIQSMEEADGIVLAKGSQRHRSTRRGIALVLDAKAWVTEVKIDGWLVGFDLVQQGGRDFLVLQDKYAGVIWEYGVDPQTGGLVLIEHSPAALGQWPLVENALPDSPLLGSSRRALKFNLTSLSGDQSHQVALAIRRQRLVSFAAYIGEGISADQLHTLIYGQALPNLEQGPLAWGLTQEGVLVDQLQGLVLLPQALGLSDAELPLTPVVLEAFGEGQLTREEVRALLEPWSQSVDGDRPVSAALDLGFALEALLKDKGLEDWAANHGFDWEKQLDSLMQRLLNNLRQAKLIDPGLWEKLAQYARAQGIQGRASVLVFLQEMRFWHYEGGKGFFDPWIKDSLRALAHYDGPITELLEILSAQKDSTRGPFERLWASLPGVPRHVLVEVLGRLKHGEEMPMAEMLYYVGLPDQARLWEFDPVFAKAYRHGPDRIDIELRPVVEGSLVGRATIKLGIAGQNFALDCLAKADRDYVVYYLPFSSRLHEAMVLVEWGGKLFVLHSSQWLADFAAVKGAQREGLATPAIPKNLSSKETQAAQLVRLAPWIDLGFAGDNREHLEAWQEFFFKDSEPWRLALQDHFLKLYASQGDPLRQSIRAILEAIGQGQVQEAAHLQDLLKLSKSPGDDLAIVFNEALKRSIHGTPRSHRQFRARIDHLSQNFVQKPLIDKILDDPRLRLYDNPDWPQWREDLKRIRQATANSPLPQTTLDFHLHSFILPRLESGGLSIEVDFVEQVISRIQSIQEQSSSRSQNRRPSGPTSVIPFRPGFKKNKK